MIINGNVTGDHAEIAALTRSQQRQKIVESLPKNIQDSIYPVIKKFFGGKEENAKDWLVSIEEFVTINSLNLGAAFDLLLHGDAKELWIAFKETQKTPASDQDVKGWFILKYVKSKSFLQNIEDMSLIKQRSDERFENFIIRVRKLVREVLSANQTEDMIVKDIVTRRMYSEKVKDVISMNPDVSLTEIEKMNVNFENILHTEDSREVFALADERKQSSYASVTRNKIPVRQNVQPIIRPSVPETNRYISQKRNYENYDNRPHGTERRRSSESLLVNERPNRPMVSLKHIARRVYNKAKGLPEPELRQLQPGQCYCCGETGHIRNNCPLNKCCLICGKNDHFFNNCPLLRSNNTRRIHCIQEENNLGNLTYSYDDLENDVTSESEVNEIGSITRVHKKNVKDHPLNEIRSMANISSVESLN